jgi:hypothetical protein
MVFVDGCITAASTLTGSFMLTYIIDDVWVRWVAIGVVWERRNGCIQEVDPQWYIEVHDYFVLQ